MGKIVEENKGQKTDVANGQTEEQSGDKGYFIMRVTQGGFRWEQGNGRKDNYEALLAPRDVEEAHEKCGANKKWQREK